MARRRRRSSSRDKALRRRRLEGSEEPGAVPLQPLESESMGKAAQPEQETPPPRKKPEAAAGAGSEEAPVVVDIPEPEPEPAARAKPEGAVAPEPESEPDEVLDLPEPESQVQAPPQAEPGAPLPTGQTEAAAPRASPGSSSSRTAVSRGSSSSRTAVSRGSSGRLAARTGTRRSSRREAEESPASRRTSGRQRAEIQKSPNYALIIISVVAVALVAVVLAWRPMEKRAFLKAVASGSTLGYDAAWAMPGFGAGVIPRLCGIIERGPGKGRLAAAGALACIARAGWGEAFLDAVRARLDAGLPPEARAAYAAALSQSGLEEAARAAAPLVTDPSASVRRCVVQGLAYGKRTPAAAKALGQALGDEEAPTAQLAEATLLLWAGKSSELVVEAVNAAMEIETAAAHERAARLLPVVAGRLGDERLKVFLRDDSPLVRRAAARAVARSNSADPDVHRRLAEIIGSPAEPADVREAALEAAAAVRAGPAGDAALGVLKALHPGDRGKVRLRAKAAGVVAATCPEGAIDALLGILSDTSAPDEIRLGVLEAFFAAGKIRGETQVRVARELVALSAVPEGGGARDETMAGVALLALRSVSGMRGAKYGPAQWRKWVERRAWEQELIEKAHLVLEKVKAEYAEHGDPDRAIQSELFNTIGPLLNKAYGDADQWDKDAIHASRSAINKYKNSLR